MKKLRLFDSLKFVVAAIVCTFILNVAHAATLPAGYTELQYLEFDNQSYLNTGIIPEKTQKIELKARLVTDDSSLFGAGQNTNNRTQLYMYQNYISLRAWSGSTPIAKIPYTRNQIYDIAVDFTNGILTMDNNSVSFAIPSAMDITSPIYINVDNVSGNLSGGIGANAYYSFKVWNSGNLIQNLVPARRDSDGVVGMYDLMDSNPATAFHTNAGTGTFVAGPAVPIKIATTKYNEQQFAPVETRLDAAVAAVDTVVTQTMTQAQAIDQIATNKQTRPDEGCTAKYCLLVEDEDGTPHWYPIAGANGVEYVLPAGYTKLEYLKKTEMSQYIQTNYIGNLKSRYEGAIYIGNDVSYWTRDAYYIASRETENGNTRNIALGGSSNGFYVGYGGFVSTNRFSLVQGKKVDFITDYVNRTWSVNIDGVAQTETISSNAIITSFVNTAPLQIFFVKPEDYPDDYVNYSSFPGVRVYYLRIYEDNSLVHEFIPVRRDSDGVLGMYDLADSNPATAFYTNAGTGEFVAGPDM